MLRKYYYLAKPGIIYGNLMTTAAGFLLASHFHIYIRLLIATMLGIALVIASACVFNNCIDRDIDKKMERTKQRSLVNGEISMRNALIYAITLGLSGLLLLSTQTNLLTVSIGAVGFIDYVIFYGYAKRHSSWGTLVGSISGAMPIVAGYTAVTNHFDTGAKTLFFILVFWQMPHFYAIAIRRFGDYKKAGLPVLPVSKGIWRTKVHILLYIAAFMIACAALTLRGYTGVTFLAVMSALGIAWLRLGFRGLSHTKDVDWAKQMFLFSLVIILALSVMLPLGAILP